jgi:hypothetical protein
MAPPLSMGPCKARAFGLGGVAVGSLVLGAETQPIKKQRGGRGLGLGGCRSGWENTTTNQKLAFAVGRILGRVRDHGGMCGGSVSLSFGVAKGRGRNK